ncbi:MAG: hypothetical protein QF682_10155 [Candidatus Thermoplasmatota archaeon]|nr:hypothetical protein [Candidatus Thermoplasmatota archaeon]
MKITCPKCKRRFKAKSSSKITCKCGLDLTPISSNYIQDKFCKHNWTTVGKIADRFLNATYPEERNEIVKFLIQSARDPTLQMSSMVCASQILRLFFDDRSVDLNRSLTRIWPHEPILRHEYANSLDLTETRSNNIEALKQRILGTKLELEKRIVKNQGDQKSFDKVLKKYIRRLEKIQNFLDGKCEHPTKKISEIIAKRKEREKHPSLLDELAQIYNICHFFETEPKIEYSLVCILDTNAISRQPVGEILSNKYIQFYAPLEILLEISNWRRVERIPLSLDAVNIRDVTISIPPEIDNMFSKQKGRPPSLADKKVATLALELNADAIISDDRDLWSSDMTYQLEKNLGRRIEVIRPKNFSSYIKKKGYEIV